jgi:antagonist of KipI
VLPGPHADRFGVDALNLLASFAFRISPQSNRIGYRLERGKIPTEGHTELLSVSMAMGSIQVPSSGDPILLMADRGTTGGYPVIAIVITADLPIVAQLAPGDSIRFVPCVLDEALNALELQERGLYDNER